MTEQQYLNDGCEIVNALIVKADISTDDIPSVDVQLKLPTGGVVFGGICFGQSIQGSKQMPHGWDLGMTAIFRIMQVADVSRWSCLGGRPVRAVLKNGTIKAMGHFMEDIFMDYREPPFSDGQK